MGGGREGDKKSEEKREGEEGGEEEGSRRDDHPRDSFLYVITHDENGYRFG